MKKSLLVIALSSSLLLGGCGSSPTDLIKDETGLNDSQAAQVVESLKSVGVEDFDKVDDLNKEKGMFFVLSQKYGKIYFHYADGKLQEITNAQFVPLMEGDKKINNAADTYLSDEQVAEYQVIAHNAIKAQLKAPDTADFTDKHTQRFGDKVKVEGTFSAQNSFGATLTKHFYVLINFDNKTPITAEIQ